MDARSPLNRMRITLIALAASLATGCASATLQLDSSPQKAEVYVSTGFGEGAAEAKRIGTTPLTIKASEVSNAVGQGGPIYVEFRKERHNPARAVITDASASDLRLSLALTAQSGLENEETLNSVVDLSFEAQRLALTGRFDEALSKLKQAQKDTPQLAAPYEIEAGIYFMQKRLPEALDAYRTAARLNPRNPEAVRMRNFLETSLEFEGKSAPKEGTP